MARTETVTILFTDLVGSTALTSSLHATEADDLRQTHFGLLRRAISAGDGVEVKNLGDGLMVRFGSPSQAVTCAVTMQQMIERHNRKATDRPLAIRIGISTGEAVEEEGDYFGDPVVQAARLCALARGGQILMPGAIRFLLGRHSSHDMSEVGALELKGIPEPMAAVEVLWEVAPVAVDESGRPPFPVRLMSAIASGPFPFAGRTKELADLETARKRAEAGEGIQTVLISGEPGMGKTTLSARAAQLAHDDGSEVLLATCEEQITVPYELWIPILAHLLEDGGHTVADLRPTHSGALARLMPALVDRLPADRATIDDPDTARFLLLEATVALLATASRSRDAPLVIVLDDLQWADAASLLVLRHLVANAEQIRVLVVAAYRASELTRTHALSALLADVPRIPSVTRLDLTGLDDVAVVQLLESAAGHGVGEEGVSFAHQLRRETGGNPFFVAELLRHLVETGMIVQDDQGRYALATAGHDMSLPGSVRDVVGRRVARLGEEDARILSAAAVIGREFDMSVLAGLVAADEDEVLDVLERAVAAALVEEVPDEPGRHRFVHSLIRQTLYEDISATRRQRLHHQVAELLETLTSPDDVQVRRLGELARHWQAATRPADHRKALDYTRRAGDAAMAAMAPADAVDWYLQALELVDRQPEGADRVRCELLLRLGQAQLETSPTLAYDTLGRAGDEADRIGSTDLLVTWALTRLPSWRTSEPPDPDRLRRLQRVLDLLADDDHALRARLLAAMAEETDPADWRHRRELADAAMAAAAEAADDEATLEVFLSTQFITSGPDRSGEAINWGKTAVALAEDRHDPQVLTGSLLWLGTSCMVNGDIDGARRAAERVAEVANAYGSPSVLNSLNTLRASLAMLEGDFSTLERAAEDELTLGMGGLPSALATYGGMMFQMRWAQGRLTEIAQLATAALDDLPTYSGFRAAVAILYCNTGQLDLAREVLDSECADDFEKFPFDMVWLSCMALFAEAAVDLDHSRAQVTLYQRLVPFADLHCAAGPIFYGSTQRAVGRLAASLGRFEEAEMRLRLAIDEHRRIGASFWMARSIVDLAEILLEPRPDEASSLLDEARRLAGDRYGDVTARAKEIASRRRSV